MKLLVLLVILAACEKTPPKPPPLDELDRTCTTTDDCMIAFSLACCYVNCGDDLGDAVNAKAWAKANEVRKQQCEGKECPHVLCSEPPACRDVARAECKAGKCERVIEKTPACEVKIDAGVEAEATCETAADCEVVREGDDCCDSCGRVMTKQAAANLRVTLAHECSGADKSKCPRLDCPRVLAACIDKKCVKRELVPRDLGQPK